MTRENQRPPENSRNADSDSKQAKLLELAELRQKVAELERDLALEEGEAASADPAQSLPQVPQSKQNEEDRQAEQDARETLIAAERVSSMANLARAIAHEINNPLSMCLGYLQRAVDLADKCDNSDALDDTLRRLSRGANRIRGIVSELQLLSEEMIGESEKLDLAHVVRRVCTLVPPDLRAFLDLDLHPVDVWVDRPRLYQIAHNMIMPYLLALKDDADSGAESVLVRCCPTNEQDALLEVVSDTVPSAGTRTDLLSAIRGEYTTNTLPLRLARRLALEVGAQWHEGQIEDGRYRTAAAFSR